MIHAYIGNGKGKTTAAMGLALRAAGNDWHVAIVQFLKSGASGETHLLADLPNVSVRAGKGTAKFTFAMDDADRTRARTVHDANLAAAIDEIAVIGHPLDENADSIPEAQSDGRMSEASKPTYAGSMLVLDEVLDAIADQLVDEALVRRALELSDARTEIVLTGRSTPPFVAEAADYITDMRCVRHPYQKGVRARKGVEL